MQNHGKRGRNRPSPNPRGGRMGGRGPPPIQQTREMFHGVYSDKFFTHVAALLKGCTVLLQVKSGSIYEGILSTVSAQAEIVLEAAHMLNQPGMNSNSMPELINKVSFKSATVVSITAKDVDPEFAVTESLMTDAEIARRQNGQAGERELEEWQGTPTEGDSLMLDGSGDVHSNGWSAEEMFKTNESRYGVTSSYDDSLPEYTTSLDQSNPKVYQERKDMADRVAREMENSPQTSSSAEADDITEEDKFSAVSRSSEAAGNRYIPPHLRENTRGGHPSQHAPGPRRTQGQLQRMPGPGRPPMSSPHHTHSPPHPHTQVQGHPHGHPHQPMQQQQQPPVHMYPNQQTRIPQPGPQPSLPLQQQTQQHQQPLQHQQQQQQQQLQKHHPPPQQQQQQPAQVHLPSHARTPPQQPGQTPPRVLPPTQMPSRPLGLGSQSPRSSPLPNTDTSPSVREEKPHPAVTEERHQQSTDDSSKRKPETSPPERTSESATPAVPEKNHKNEKTIAELKEFRDTFIYETKPVEEEPSSIPSTQAGSEAKSPTTTEKPTPIVPQPAEDRETKDMDTSSGKDSPSNPNKDKDKQLNPLAKPFVPTFTRNPKTPTPPRPQLSSSPAMVIQHNQPFPPQPNMVPYVLSSGQGFQGTMPTPQQTAVAQAQVSHMGQKPMMQKKGFAYAGSATNIPHQRPQPPSELPTLIPTASMAAGQPLVSPMGYPHHSQMLHYPPQPGLPGQPMLPQAAPYQMYQTKHPVPYRQIQPQPSIQGVPQPTAAPHIHTLPEGSIQGTSPVLVSNTQLQAQAGQVQQSMHAQISHQQQQQQAQQQQQQHAQQQSQQQQQQAQHHHHPQPVVHLQAQHQHPHAQPHTTPPQQQTHGSQPSQIPQPQPPPQPQQPQQQQQQQQQQHRPTPSPVHHMPHQQHQGHQPLVSQHQNMPHHLHPQSQQILYHQTPLQPGHLQSMAIQSSQPQQQQQQQFGGPHPYVPQYITSTTIPATNITSVTPVHTNPHPHPTQANWMILQGQPMNPMVHNSGQMAAHLLPQPQGLSQAHGHVQAFQQGN